MTCNQDQSITLQLTLVATVTKITKQSEKCTIKYINLQFMTKKDKNRNSIKRNIH